MAGDASLKLVYDIVNGEPLSADVALKTLGDPPFLALK